MKYHSNSSKFENIVFVFFFKLNNLSIFTADCPSGTHSSSSGKCVLCNKGNYQDESGQTSCKSCPYGKTTAFVGSQSQLDCSGKRNMF